MLLGYGFDSQNPYAKKYFYTFIYIIYGNNVMFPNFLKFFLVIIEHYCHEIFYSLPPRNCVQKIISKLSADIFSSVPQARLFLTYVIKLLINPTLSLSHPASQAPFLSTILLRLILFVNIVFSYK